MIAEQDRSLEYVYRGVRIPYDGKIAGMLDEMAKLDRVRAQLYDDLTHYVSFCASQRQNEYVLNPTSPPG